MSNLVKAYEKKLKDVKESWGYLGDRGQEYIDFAEGELEAVKTNGVEGLKEFWATHSVN